MRAVGYFRQLDTRRLSDAFERPAGAEAPRAAIERYCVEEFHSLIAFIPDDCGSPTGEEDEVDRFEELTAFLGAEGMRAALVVIPDSRHLADDLETLAARLLALENIGAGVRCADPDMPDPLQSGLELLGMRGRSPERARRIRESIVLKASRGEVLGRTPFGYEPGPDGLPAPVPAERQVVADIFRWYTGEAGANGPSGGEGGPGMGLRRIAAELNERGARTRKGNPWTPVAIAGILRNRAYLGTYSRLGFRLVDSHQPLVDRRLFNRAQELLAERRPRRKRPQARPFLLGGLARCGLCGRGVHGLTRARTWQRRDGTTAKRAYRYYECPSRVRSRTRADAARHPSWRAQKLEEAVIERIEGAAAGRLREELEQTSADDGAAEMRRAERDFMRTFRRIASGRGGVSSLAAPLAALRRARETPPADAQPGRTIGDAVAALRAGEGPSATAALRSLVQRVVVTGEGVELVTRF